MVSTAQIVLLGMNHHRTPNNRVLPVKRNQLVSKAQVRIAKRVSHQVAQVPDVSLLRKRTAMLLVIRVEMGSSSCAPLSQISELVDVNTVFSVRIEALNGKCYFGRGVDAVLTKRCYSSHIRLVRV